MTEPGVCSECGSDELWAWYTQPERQTIDVEIKDGKVTYDYTFITESSYDAGEDTEYLCAGCSRITETIEEMVGLPVPAVPPGPDAWVRERARRGLGAAENGEIEVVWEVLKALAEYRTDDQVINDIVNTTPAEFS